jgi:hypothetical protein
MWLGLGVLTKESVICNLKYVLQGFVKLLLSMTVVCVKLSKNLVTLVSKFLAPEDL